MRKSNAQQQKPAPETVPGKQKRKHWFSSRFFAYFFACCCLFLLLLFALMLFLPRALEKQAGKILDQFSGDGLFLLQIKHIGWFRTEFSLRSREPMLPGRQDAPALNIRSCSLRYRPAGLLKGHLEEIEFDGFSLNLDLTSGKPLLPALALLKKDKSPGSKEKQKPAAADWYAGLPVRFDRLRLNGELLLLTGQENIPVSCNLRLTQDPTAEWPVWNYEISLLQASNRLKIEGRCDLPGAGVSGKVQFSGQSDSLPWSLRQRLPAEFALQSSGSGTFNVDLAGKKFTALDAILDSQLKYQQSGFQTVCQPRLQLRSENGRILAELTALQAEAAGVNIAIEQLTACLTQPENAVLSGSCRILVNQQNVPLTSFSLSRRDGVFHLSIQQQKNAEQPDIVLTRSGLTFRSQPPEFQLSATLRKSLKYQLSATLNQPRLTAAGLNCQAGSIKLEVQGEGSTGQLQTVLQQGNLIPAGGIEVSLPEASLQATFQPGQVHGACRLSGAAVRHPGSGLAATLSADIPLHWPLSEQPGPIGFVKTDSLTGNDETLGQIDGHFIYRDQSLSFLADARLRGLQAALRATWFPAAAENATFLEAGFSLPEQSLPPEILPERWLPMLKGFTCSGKLTAGAEFRIQANRPQGDAFVKIEAGQIRNPANDFALDDLRLDIRLPELPKLSSGGNQLFAFRNFQFGKFAVQSGRVRFRMESPSCWHLENVTMNWCDGKLKLDSTRINPENQRTSLIFHCDRLRLSALLQQLGAGLDQGEGRISGTIPLILTADGLRFRDAFLYSTPGETGSIKLLPGQSIRATAAASDQLAFALDALADFNYSWVKLSLNSEKELLKIKLQTDGRPAGKLYYIPKDGTLVRSQVANDFTGLQLDANLNIPLNNTLQLYQNFKQLLNP